jgi:uncharacterized protein YdiU (UPF0061 family)
MVDSNEGPAKAGRSHFESRGILMPADKLRDLVPWDPQPFNFDNSYARDLEGFYVPWKGAEVPAPKMVRFNRALAEELQLDPAALDSDAGAAIFAGHTAPEGASPLAMAYAGHQFGGFSAQLGDGRALLLGEVIDGNGARRDIHLKGSGRTPFSRGGDGKAVLGPVLREYIIGEAMHALGVPTTRALAAVTTGEEIMRQNGPRTGRGAGAGGVEPSARGDVPVLCRAGRDRKAQATGRLRH